MSEFILSPKPAKDLKIDYRNDLNDQQFDVVQQGDGPVLVLAGAGSGKTRTITYRVAWLLEHGVDPRNVLLLTFTNKAAREMISRVEGLLGDSAQGLWAGTFHSVANRILRKYAPKLGFESNFSILDQEDARDLISLCVKELKINTKGKRFPSATVLQGMISYSRNSGASMPEMVESRHPRFIPLINDINAVAEAYERYKQANNSMDFDDLLLKLLLLLENDKQARENLAGQFQYVLVDEFQDTNHIQARIVQWLASVHKNIFVVGDDAQSIYSFRAADISNILQFPDSYPQAQTFHLTRNYRSTPEILNIANEVIASNTKQFKKSLEAVADSGELPKFVPANSQSQEAHYIADQVSSLIRSGEHHGEIAVLFRAAFHSQSLEFELMRRDINYEYRGGLKFFERAHVKDAVAHLRLIHNTKDVSAWMRVLRIHPGIGMVTAQKIAQAAAGVENIDDVFALMPVKGAKALQGWQLFLNLLRELRSSLQTPADYIRALAGSSVYKDYLEHEYPNASERLDDLEQFIAFAEQYTNLQSFLDDVALTQEYGAREEDRDAENRIILSTVHQAKGLEWNHVFVINVAEGSFPHKNCVSDEEVEEERRLFYVAITRARNQLHLTYPQTSGRSYDYQQHSMFIDEIGSDRLDKVQLRSGGMRFVQSSKYSRTSGSMYDEPTIVLSDDGEVASRPAPNSFLKSVNDLGDNNFDW